MKFFSLISSLPISQLIFDVLSMEFAQSNFEKSLYFINKLWPFFSFKLFISHNTSFDHCFVYALTTSITVLFMSKHSFMAKMSSVFMKIIKYSTICYQQNLTPTEKLVERLENRQNGEFKTIKCLI